MNVPRKGTALNSLAEFALQLGYPCIWRHLEDAREVQWRSLEQVRELSWRRFKNTLEYAYLYVPFYRQKFRAARITPQDIRAPSDIAAIPTTSKDELRQALHERWPLSTEFSADQVKPLSTTGSTGKPLTFAIDRHAEWRRMAITFRNIEWYGHRLGDRNARIWGRGTERLPWWHWDGFVRRLEAQVLGRRLELVTHDYAYVSASSIDEAKLALWCQRIRRYRPKVIDGYVSALSLLAKYVLDHRETDLGCEALATGGEYLSPQARKLLEEAFRCPVFNRYGGNEAGFIRHECGENAQHKLHINADSLWLEIVRDNRHVEAGDYGEIVVTDFTNRATPLIRYRLEDVGVAASPDELCACGRGLPLIDSVEGRINDLFYLPDGRVIVSHVWHDVFLQPFVDDFQLLQRQPGLVQVKVALNKARSSSGQVHELKQRVAACLPGCDIVWEEVDHLTPGPGGKFRHSMSEVPSELNAMRGNYQLT